MPIRKPCAEPEPVAVQKVMAADGSGEAAADLLLEEFARECIAWYRAEFPDGRLSDETLRARAIQAAQRLEFNEFDNLAPGRALQLAARGQRGPAATLLERRYEEQRLVGKGAQAGRWQTAGNEAQAQARLESLPADHPLRNAPDHQARDQQIRTYADRLRTARPNLGAADIERRVGAWAQMSRSQIRRILNPPNA
ncbi:MAG: hypothetical protein ACREU3_17745 [Steroidobacteraceae bacterium]